MHFEHNHGFHLRAYPRQQGDFVMDANLPLDWYWISLGQIFARAENSWFFLKTTISQKIWYFVPIWVNLAQDSSRSHLEVNMISYFSPETDFWSVDKKLVLQAELLSFRPATLATRKNSQVWEPKCRWSRTFSANSETEPLRVGEERTKICFVAKAQNAF